MHSQVTQPGPRGAWRGTDRSGGSRGPRSRTSRTRGRIPRSFMAATICSDSARCTRDRSRLGATRTGILMSSTFDSGERDHRKSLSSPTRLCSPPSWTCTAARGCASGGDWIPRRSGSPTTATCAFGEGKGEPRLGSVPTRRPRRQTAQDFVLVRTPPQAVPTLRPWRAPSDRRCRAHRSTCQSAVGGEFSNFCFRLVSMSCRISAKPRWG